LAVTGQGREQLHFPLTWTEWDVRCNLQDTNPKYECLRIFIIRSGGMEEKQRPLFKRLPGPIGIH
jgi:hypothetical protein